MEDQTMSETARVLSAREEVDRMLKLLREKIRDQGFTQLKVQEALGWGRTYISQLFRKQKSLRFDQILLILQVIEIDAAEFFAEFYAIPYQDGYGRPRLAKGARGRYASRFDDVFLDLDEMRVTLDTLTRHLVEKEIIDSDEFEAALEAGPGPGPEELFLE